jgi:polysaccharide export outer membrane protein
MKKTLLILIVLQLLLIAVGYADAATDEFSVINVKDKLSITVVDNPGLSTEVVVLEDGYINFPYIGSLYVKGRRVKDVEAEITKKLGEGFLKYPVVSVRLSRGFETRSIFLYGEVQKRGDMPFQEKLTVLKALSLAGGMTEDGLYGDVKIRRKVKSGKNYENIVIDIEGIINESQSEDILLQPDDVVIVDRNKTYIVEGEVGKPGKYPLKKGMTVSRALSEAGGITKEGLYGAVKVRRKQREDQTYKDIDIVLGRGLENNVSGDMLLRYDDILIVERNDIFYIYGEVNKPGDYALQKGLTAFTALSLAGGLTKWGSQDQIKILRRSAEEKNTFVKIKVNIEDVIKGDASADALLYPGDILIISSGIF